MIQIVTMLPPSMLLGSRACFVFLPRCGAFIPTALLPSFPVWKETVSRFLESRTDHCGEQNWPPGSLFSLEALTPHQAAMVLRPPESRTSSFCPPLCITGGRSGLMSCWLPHISWFFFKMKLSFFYKGVSVPVPVCLCTCVCPPLIY